MSKLNLFTIKNGFTLIELMIAIAVVAILTMVALPNLNSFTVRMRVDNEISELNRLLLTARNVAVNEGISVTVCSLSLNSCTANWKNELSVFTDVNSNGVFEPLLNERIIKVKSAIKSNDKLQYGQNNVTYASTGLMTSAASNTPFSYCPIEDATRARGIVISISGRIYSTSDIDNDDKDEDRSGNEITCI